MTDKAKVLIIIVHYKGHLYLGDCLRSIVALDPASISSDVMIIDNSPTDGTVAACHSILPEAIIVSRVNNVGFAVGNNVGFEYALVHGYEYVYLLNQDALMTPTTLAAAVAVATTDGNIAAVQSKILLTQHPETINTWGNQLHYLGFGWVGGYGQPDQSLVVREIAYGSGAGLLIRVSVLRQIGGFFSDFFMYLEDLDFGWRCRLAGYRTFLAPESVIYHTYQPSGATTKYYYLERNRWWVLLINYHIATIVLLLPALFVTELMIWLQAVAGGWWRDKLRSYIAYGNLDAWKNVWRQRYITQKSRQRRDRWVTSIFSGALPTLRSKKTIWQYCLEVPMWCYWHLVRLLLWW